MIILLPYIFCKVRTSHKLRNTIVARVSYLEGTVILREGTVVLFGDLQECLLPGADVWWQMSYLQKSDKKLPAICSRVFVMLFYKVCWKGV